MRAAAIYPVAKRPEEVRISWTAMRRGRRARGRAGVQAEPRRLLVLPAAVSEPTAMPHSADRHNKTTSRPTPSALRVPAPPRTAAPVGAAPPVSLRQWAGAAHE